MAGECTVEVQPIEPGTEGLKIAEMGSVEVREAGRIVEREAVVRGRSGETAAEQNIGGQIVAPCTAVRLLVGRGSAAGCDGLMHIDAPEQDANNLVHASEAENESGPVRERRLPASLQWHDAGCG